MTFLFDSRPLYKLVFTISPGSIFGAAAEQTLVVSCIQGVAGELDAINFSTKLCHGCSPLYILFSACQAFSSVLNVRVIVGISTACQIARYNAGKKNMLFFMDYNEFWRKLGAVEKIPNYFLLTLPVKEKPLLEIKRNHRSRTARKRMFKSRVFEEVQKKLLDYRIF
jgi:hypothetical protein